MTGDFPWRLPGVAWLLLHCTFLCAAQGRIDGKVTDDKGAPIPFCSAVLSDSSGTSILKYAMTDTAGYYRVPIENAGRFRITFSALGFSERSFHLTAHNADTIIEINAKLTTQPLQLGEVIVEARKPVVVRNDTVIFDADSFRQGNEEVVEDLLKKIPGLDVDEEGTIRVAGKEVEKVMVEGSDFFEKGYKVLTKNMPAYAVDQVELLQHYAENKLLKGIEDSDKLALNLKLDEEVKNQWVANVKAGYGTDRRHSANANAFSVGPGNKYYFLADANNIGHEAFGDRDAHIQGAGGFGNTTIGDDNRAEPLISLNPSELDIERTRTNFNNEKLLSTNAIFTPNDKTTIKATALFNSDAQMRFNSLTEEYRVADAAFTNRVANAWRNRSTDLIGKLELSKESTSDRTFRSRTAFHYLQDDRENALHFNEEMTEEALKTKFTRFDHYFTITKRLTESTVYLVNGRYIYDARPQDYTVDRVFFSDYFIESEAADRAVQANRSTMHYGGLEAIFMKRRRSGNLIEFRIANELSDDRLSTMFSVHDSTSESIYSPEGYQNKMHYLLNNSSLSAKYQKGFRRSRVFGQMKVHFLYNQMRSSENITNVSMAYIVPSIGWSWTPNNANSLTANLVYNTNTTDVLTVYNNWVMTGFRTMRRGTGAFTRFNTSTAVINFRHGSWATPMLMNIMVFYMHGHKFLSTSTTLRQELAQTAPIIRNGRAMGGVSLELDRFISALSCNAKLEATGSLQQYDDVVNDAMRSVQTTNATLGVELRSAFRGFFNGHAGLEWSFDRIETAGVFYNASQTGFLDVIFRLSTKADIVGKVEGYRYRGDAVETTTRYFADVDAKYTVKPNKLTFTLSGKNLANTTVFRTTSVSDISASTSGYRLIPRYVMFSVEYRF